MKFTVMNLGCKVNSFEAESIANALEKRGYQRVERNEPADITLIFTCAVTNMAAQKSRKMLHQARRLNPNGIIAAVGCYVQIDAEHMPEADLLVGTEHKLEIPDMIDQYMQNHKNIIRTEMSEVPSFEPMTLDHFESRTRASLRIQDGCNQFCSYCIIPYARGRERSMTPEMAIDEAVRLSQNNHEIVLAGIHTGRYGKEYGITLAEIMKRMLAAADQLQRLRISSIELNEIDDGLIELMQNDRRVARHLHIPLQSGCSSVLKRMGRPYDTETYYDRIETIRKTLPGISISTDLITGFPGETEEEFQETYDFLKKCRFSFLHVFPYSEREGTAAAARTDQIDPQIRKERARKCIDLSSQLYAFYMDTFLNKNVEVMCETAESGKTFGHSSEYLPVYIKGECRHGEMADARILERNGLELIAERVNADETE